jgi:hypothetical protein
MDYFFYIDLVGHNFLYYLNYAILYIIFIYIFKKKIVPELQSYYQSIQNIYTKRDLILEENQKFYNKMKLDHEEKCLMYNNYKKKLLIYISKKNTIIQDKQTKNNDGDKYKKDIEKKIYEVQKTELEKKIFYQELEKQFIDKTDSEFILLFTEKEEKINDKR